MSQRNASSPLLALLYISLFTALIIVGSYIRIPLAIPITLQTLFIYLAALSIGWSSLASVGAYLILGAFGLPVFAGGGSGLAYLFGPTGGFLLGFLLLTAVIAWIARGSKKIIRNTFALIFGTVVLYAAGSAWFSLVQAMPYLDALSLTVIPFIVGDLIKIVVSILVYRIIAPYIMRNFSF